MRGKRIPTITRARSSIKRIYEVKDVLKDDIKIAYLANYDLALGALLTAGVDVWLNTPQSPLEASGTSGMKAALNGVPSLSVLDGWWLEGCIEGITGWAIGSNHRGLAVDDDRAQDAAALYDKLEQVILPLFYRRPAGLPQCHASRHRAQWLVLQYPAHDAAIRREGVFSVNGITRHGQGRSRSRDGPYCFRHFVP